MAPSGASVEHAPTEQAVWESVNRDPKPLGINLHLLSIMLRLSGIKHFLGSKSFLGKTACITVLLILHICTGRKQKDLRSLSLSKCAGIDH